MSHPTKFEKSFGLKPLGDDTVTRLERMENLVGLFIRASMRPGYGSELQRADVHSPSYSSHITLPLPAESEVVEALAPYRTSQALARQEAQEEADRQWVEMQGYDSY